MLEEGFYDGWTGNIKYLNLIESTGVANLDKDIVLNQLSGYADINEKVIQHEASSPDVNPINVKIVYEHIWRRKSINWISDEQGIEKLEVARIINKFRKSKKQRMKANKRQLGKDSKLDQHHVEFIQSLCQRPLGEIFVINEIKRKLLQKFHDLSNVSIQLYYF